MNDTVAGGGVFTLRCYDAEGVLKWEEATHNLVTNAGLQSMVSQYFTGGGYTATWYLGLWGSSALNTPAATDTMASHPGWTEFENYVDPARPAVVFGTATTANPSSINNTASPAVFLISGAGGVVGGAFLTSASDKGGTLGVLFSGANFAYPGNRTTIAGDVITATYSFNLAAALV